jgi:predicted outer membrane protein
MIMKSALPLLFLLPLTGCIAAIGNRGTQARELNPATRSIVREQIVAAERIVALRQQQLDSLRQLAQVGRGDSNQLIEAEIQLEEARLRLLELRAELAADSEQSSS